MQSRANALIASDELFIQTAVARIDAPSVAVNDLVAVAVMLAALLALCVMCATRIHARCCLLLLLDEVQVRAEQ